MVSVRASLSGIGLGVPFSFRTNVHHPRPQSVRRLLHACTDPELSAWSVVGTWAQENAGYSEEAQGITSAGGAWFIVSNANDAREGLYRIPFGEKSGEHLSSPHDVDETHLGALTVSNGWVYVPTQHPFGIWKVSTDFSKQAWLPASDLPQDDMFAWCDINPENGLLYTSHFTRPEWLYAYDARAEADAPLVRSGPDILIRQQVPETTRVQSACFTPSFRILMLVDVDGAEGIHCHSTLTGAFQGRRELLADTEEDSAVVRNELEAICLRSVTVDGTVTQVQVLELDNEIHSSDDIYLWGLGVPHPERL
jgi:hypothetical protein